MDTSSTSFKHTDAEKEQENASNSDPPVNDVILADQKDTKITKKTNDGIMEISEVDYIVRCYLCGVLGHKRSECGYWIADFSIHFVDSIKAMFSPKPLSLLNSIF